MKKNLSLIKMNDSIVPSTNFHKFLNYFEDKSILWIENINKNIENE